MDTLYGPQSKAGKLTFTGCRFGCIQTILKPLGNSVSDVKTENLAHTLRWIILNNTVCTNGALCLLPSEYVTASVHGSICKSAIDIELLYSFIMGLEAALWVAGHILDHPLRASDPVNE